MKALIVDDHKINRVYLNNLVKDHFPKITVIDEAESVAASLELLAAQPYDLIFLDIELKDGIGFDVLGKVTDSVPVIVISGHKEYALDAFKHSVMDYLLRPINIDEFKRAVKKAIDQHEKSALLKTPGTDEEAKAKSDAEDNLLINYKNNYIAVAKKEVLFIKAQGKYSEIHVTDGRHYTSYKNLKEFETNMADIMVRIHHSYLVNINYIVSYSRDTSQLTLSTGAELPVSVRKREDLFRKFSVF